jgi:hypothetical protein
MPDRKLTHAAFWERMDRAVRHVDKYPDWLKGSPVNERPLDSFNGQQIDAAGGNANESSGSPSKDPEQFPL